ncbi:hypothetical protein GTQ99_24015, partial [Kineococcus sp. T13]
MPFAVPWTRCEPAERAEPALPVALHPFAGLRLSLPAPDGGRVELRTGDVGALVELAELAARGVHADDRMPFAVPWTRCEPAERAEPALPVALHPFAGLRLSLPAPDGGRV